MRQPHGVTQIGKIRAGFCRNREKRRRLAAAGIWAAIVSSGSLLFPWMPSVKAATTQFLVPSSAVHSASLTLSGTQINQVKDVVRGGTVYLPVYGLQSVLSAMGVTATWNGDILNLTPKTGKKAPSFQPADPNQKGVAVDNRIVATASSFAYLGTTYLPIKIMMTGLNAISVPSSWDGHTWAFVKPTRTQPGGTPHVPKPPTHKSTPSPKKNQTTKTTNTQTGSLETTKPQPAPMVYTFALEYSGKTLSWPDIMSHDSLLSNVAEFNAYVTPTESLRDVSIPSDATTLPGWSNKLQLTVANLGPSNFNGSMMAGILSRPSRTNKLIHNILFAANQDKVSGINLDFEALPPSARGTFSSFVAKLHHELSARGKSLVVDVPAETQASTPSSYTGAYDYSAIGKNADEVVIMAYDYSYPGGPAGAIAPVWWVNQVADYTASQISPNKVLLGVPTYAYDWAASSTRGLSLASADSLLRSLHVRPLWNGSAQEPYYTYYNNNGLHTVYYEDTASLKAKLLVATRHHFAGIAFWRVGLETPAFWKLLSSYRADKLS